MTQTELNGQGITDGIAEGTALVSPAAIAFNLGVDERRGVVVEKGHPLEGQPLKDCVLVFPGGKGSTASSFSILQIVQRGVGPVAMVNVETDAIVAAGAVLANIPLVHRCAPDPVTTIRTGDLVRVDGTSGTVRILRRAS